MRSFITLLTLATVPTTVQAQTGVLGIDLMYTKPYGEFGHNVRQGTGIAGMGVVSKRGSPFGIRFDLSYLNYGTKKQHAWFDVFFGQYLLNQVTTNNIVTFGVGPQFMVTTGNFRPYVHLLGGFSHYFTHTTLEGLNSDYFETSRTESSTIKFSYGGGTGVMIPLRTGEIPITVNVGAQFYRSGRTSYLTREDINPDEDTGQIQFTPRTTDVRYINYRIGMTIGVDIFK